MKIRRKTFILSILIIMVLISLSCNYAEVMIQGASPTDTPIIASTGSVESLATEVSSAISTAQAGGPIMLEVTEEQLTSAASAELLASGETRVRNIQIRLRDDKMILTGEVSQGGLNLPLRVSLKFIVDAQGKIHSQVVEGSVGLFSLPESYLTEITSQLDQALKDYLNENEGSLIVDSINIADGRMTVIAHKP